MPHADDFARRPAWPPPATPQPDEGRPRERHDVLPTPAGVAPNGVGTPNGTGTANGVGTANGIGAPNGAGFPGNPPAGDLLGAPAMLGGPYAQRPPAQERPAPAAPPVERDEGERVAWDLMREFRGWTCWRGECTGQWWALSPGHAPERLLSADTPHELGRRIKESVSAAVLGDDGPTGGERHERAAEMIATG